MSDLNPLISVIVPCYKPCIGFFSRAIDSILNQTYQNFEIIIVDDGNDVEGKNVIKAIKKKDKRIKVLVNKKNEGVSKARNNALKQCNGEMISYIDADDYVESYFFQEAVTYIDKCDIVIGGVVQFSKFNKKYLEEKRVLNPSINYYENENKKELISLMIGKRKNINNYGYINRGPVSRLIKKELALKCNFPENISISEDLFWNIDAIERANKIILVDQIWYCYYNNVESASHCYDDSIIEKSRTVIDTLKNRIDVNIYNEAYCNFVIENLKWINDKLIIFEEYKIRNAVKKILYGEEPWNYCKSTNYNHFSIKTRIKVLLYKMRLLFFAWNVNNIIKRGD